MSSTCFPPGKPALKPKTTTLRTKTLTRFKTKSRIVTSTTSTIAGRSRNDPPRNAVVGALQERSDSVSVAEQSSFDEAPYETEHSLYARGYCPTCRVGVKPLKPGSGVKPAKGRACCARRVTKTILKYTKSKTVKATKTSTKTVWRTVTVSAVGFEPWNPDNAFNFSDSGRVFLVHFRPKPFLAFYSMTTTRTAFNNPARHRWSRRASNWSRTRLLGLTRFRLKFQVP